MDLTRKEREVMTALQRGIAPVERPFRDLSIPEEDAVSLLARAREARLLRRFGGVFDARRLGYRSVLFALEADSRALAEKASIVAQHPGVTHCYERRPLDGVKDYPSLWFTLAMLHDAFDAGMQALRAQLGASRLLALPAMCRFKIDVTFDLRTRERDETFPGCKAFAPLAERIPEYACLSRQDRDLVRLMDQQLPLAARPFDPIAWQLGLPLADVLSRLRDWIHEGVLRRIAAILHHREAGFKANGMCVWPVAGDAVAAGRRVAARPEVTHCYQRPRLEALPFDLYAMIHTGDWAATKALFDEISAACALPGGMLFASVREFKKSSMRYFTE